MKEEPISSTLETQQDPDWSSASDSTLIQNCLQENEVAWATLIERYSRLIYTIPLRFGYSKMVADEIFQETCLILLEKLDTLQKQDRLSSWLMTVTKRLCIQRIREYKKFEIEQLNNEYEFASATIEEELAHVEQVHIVHEALSFLSERDRSLLNMLYLEEPKPSYDEIAQRLDIAKGSIGAFRSRSLKKLQAQITRLSI